MAVVTTPTGKMPKIGEGKHPWVACPECKQVLYRREWDEALEVCPSCGHHGRLSAKARVAQLCDAGSFEEWDPTVVSSDPLEFEDLKPYKQRQKQAEKSAAGNESMLTGKGKIE